MKIDRPYFKHYARESMRGRNPSVYWVSFIFILISGILTNLDITIQLNNMDMESLMDAMMAGREVLVEDIGFVGSLILLALGIMNTVITAGYQWYCMQISRKNQAGIGDIFDAFGIFFKIVWLNIVMGFFIFLWTMLLIIPGIIAGYRYSMALFILLDDPDKGAMQCIRESKAMTSGYKWELWLLDLSFIGWRFLACIPFVNIFVLPYTTITLAYYYNHLSGWRPEAEPVYETEYREPWER